MPREKIPWKWTNRREKVARLVAEDILPDREIARQGGINPSSLYIWRTKPEFMARVDQLVNGYRKRIRSTSIAVVENRIARMVRKLEQIDKVEAERARIYGGERFKDAIPGGGTGIVVIRRYRQVTDPTTGRKQHLPITAVDTDVVNTEMAILKQAAQDLGQWNEVQNENRNQALDFLKVLDQQMKAGPAKTEEPEEEKKA